MTAARVREKAVLALLLAGVAGFVDAAGYLLLRHLFTAHMSGNSAALGAHLGRGEWHEAIRRAVPVPFFVLGIVSGAVVVELSKRRGLRAPFATALVVETLLLATFVLLGSRLVDGGGQIRDGSALYPATALLALAMGVQNATLRRVGKTEVRTTYVSGTLTDMSENAVAAAFWLWDTRRDRSAPPSPGRRRALRRTLLAASVYASFLCGAIAGAWLESRFALGALGIPIGALALIIVRDLGRPLDIRRPGTA